MTRDDKLRDVVKQMRFGSPPRHVMDWADRIESALSEPVAPMNADAKLALQDMDADLALPLNRAPVAISRPWCRELRAWIHEVTGE